MTQVELETNVDRRTQIRYAKVAGFLFLWLIVTGLAGMMIVARVAGSGSFGEVAQRVVVSEKLYRLGLMIELIETLSALLLGYALYVTLKPINSALARLALYFRLTESVVGCVGMVFAYARLRVYTAPHAVADQSQALVDFTTYAGNATYNLSALSFSIGSILFFYLFYRSLYIPRALSAFGVFASVVVTLMLVVGLIVPAKALIWGWLPMAIAEVATGFWLLFATKITSRTERLSASPVLVHS
jgi:Domain of unknown function (DUF4386)